MKFGKLVGDSGRAQPPDPFGLRPFCEAVGLEAQARDLVRACRPSVAIDLVPLKGRWPHSGSRIGGDPALPDDLAWPCDRQGRPMLFWGQLACPDLALAKLTGLPDEGLLSLFVDTFEDAPQEARVYHLSWQQDLTTRTSPLGLSRTASFRPVFSTIPSLPHREHPDFRRLGLPSKTEAQYEQLLWDLEVSLRPCPVRCGGYPPYPFDSSLYPEEDPTDDWRFFLALGDLEELELSWPETGFALLWLPQDPSLQEPGRAELTWLPIWDDEDLEEDPEDEEL